MCSSLWSLLSGLGVWSSPLPWATYSVRARSSYANLGSSSLLDWLDLLSARCFEASFLVLTSLRRYSEPESYSISSSLLSGSSSTSSPCARPPSFFWDVSLGGGFEFQCWSLFSWWWTGACAFVSGRYDLWWARDLFIPGQEDQTVFRVAWVGSILSVGLFLCRALAVCGGGICLRVGS